MDEIISSKMCAVKVRNANIAISKAYSKEFEGYSFTRLQTLYTY